MNTFSEPYISVSFPGGKAIPLYVKLNPFFNELNHSDMMYPQFWYGYHFYIFYLMKIYSWCFVVFSFVTFFSIVLLPFIINIDIISILVIFKHTREFSWLHIHVIYKNLLLILVSIHFVSSNQCKNVLQILLWYLLCQHFYFWDFYFWIPTTKTNYSLTWLAFNFFLFIVPQELFIWCKNFFTILSVSEGEIRSRKDGKRPRTDENDLSLVADP